MYEYLIGAAAGWSFNKAADLFLGKLRNLNGADTGYLNHAPNFCNSHYHSERSLGGHLPYREEMDFSKVILSGSIPTIEVETNSETFFTQGKNLDWAVVRAQAYAAYRNAGHAKTDSSVVRVSSIKQEPESLKLHLQPTRYFCQAESNLVLDYQAYVSFERDTSMRRKTSLRSILSSENPGYLPAISDTRLANSLGVSVCLLSKDNSGATMLRMVNRVKDVGVFPSGIHPAMSCAIEWEDAVSATDLLSLIINDIEYEMLQETGLVRGEFEPPVILSFCREFLRGGKPQLFLLSYTDLDQNELNKRRDEQISKNKKYRPEKVEMKGSSMFSRNDPSVLVEGHSGLQFTHEGAASVYLVDRLLAQVPS
jgi:hypothetical protein